METKETLSLQKLVNSCLSSSLRPVNFLINSLLNKISTKSPLRTEQVHGTPDKVSVKSEKFTTNPRSWVYGGP